jgi:hypothetical protein
MMKPIFALCLSISLAVVASAQSKWKLYLGSGQDSLFEKSDIIRNIGGDYSFFDLAGFHTYRHELIQADSGKNMDRAGLVLAAKTTSTFGMNGEAVFGINNDTCLIVYKAQIDRVTHGRSAALSILNLVSTFPVPEQRQSNRTLMMQ